MQTATFSPVLSSRGAVVEVLSLGQCPKDQQSSCSARGSGAFPGLVSTQPVFPLPSKCTRRSHGNYVKPVYFCPSSF